MNKKLQDSYESIVGELGLSEIKSYKIGVTHNIDERKQQYLADGYSEIYPIATGENSSILQAESDLIKQLKSDSRVGSKCQNESSALGLGQVHEANVLYVAVCIRFEGIVSSMDIHLKDVLFASGFPITL